MHRMRILSAADEARFEKPPVFNSAERKRYFDFSQSVMDATQRLRSPANRIGFLLAYGYFRAARRFFSAEFYHERDIAFVAAAVGTSPDVFNCAAYNQRTRRNHQKLLLDLQGFRPFDVQAEAELIDQIATMAHSHLKPRLIFMRCTDFLVEKRIQIPGLQRLSELIRSQLSEHKSDLMQLVDMHLSSDLRVTLEDLFAQEGEEDRYRLTLLKRISQSTRPGKIKGAVADLEILADLYRQIRDLVEHETLSDAQKLEGIRNVLEGDQESVVDHLRNDLRRRARQV